MKQIPTAFWIIPAALIGLGLLALGMSKLFDWRAGYAFQHIKLGETEAKVIMYMGATPKAEPCGQLLWWDDKIIGKNDGRCVRWVRYLYFHSAWDIGYSVDGHVVSKHHEAVNS